MTKAVQLMEEKYGADVFIQPKERNNDHIETNEKMYRTSFQKDFLDDYKKPHTNPQNE